MEKRFDVDFLGFFDIYERHIATPNFCTMNLVESFGFTGTLITTNCDLTLKTLRFPNPKKRIFYVWDLEWVRHTGPQFEYYEQVYRNPKLELVTRNQDYADLIENCFNRKVVHLNENCDLEKFLEIA